LVNYSLEAIGGNLLTLSSTAREVGARFNLLQAVKFVADNLREISSKTIRNSFSHCDFKQSSLKMLNTTYTRSETFWNFSTSETTTILYASTIVFSFRKKM
jgi:hypothetical protein